VLLNYYTGSLQPAPVEEEKDLVAGGNGGIAPSIPNMPGAAAPGTPFGGAANVPTAAPELETNMELDIYGVMTIYQRYPPRGAAAAAKTQ
jgi:hypothetical protein